MLFLAFLHPFTLNQLINKRKQTGHSCCHSDVLTPSTSVDTGNVAPRLCFASVGHFWVTQLLSTSQYKAI